MFLLILYENHFVESTLEERDLSLPDWAVTYLSLELKYAKFRSNMNAIVPSVNSSLMYIIYDFIFMLIINTILFIDLFCLFSLGEISYTTTLVNPR